jgi:uncharacterized protein YcbX
VRLTSIHSYPVKSCAGHALESAAVEPWGLAGDRRWMIVDEAGAQVTAREVNRMVLVRPEPVYDGLRLTAPGLPALDVAVPDPADQVPVRVWRSSLTAAYAGDAAAAWVSAALGRAVRLVHLDDPGRRPTDPAFSEPGDRVSFADAYPVLVASEESRAALEEVAGVPLSMTRFRPNVVVSGSAAWAEDDWRRVRIGDAVFRAVKGCDRCVLTTVDPETGVRGKEPIATLARTRRWDGKTWFGVNLVPDTPGVRIRVGDDVEVLDAVPAGAGPLR